MPDLDFKVVSVEPEPCSATPILLFKLQIDQPTTEPATPIHAIALRCQIRLDPARRRYTDLEKHRLLELFGRPQQWSRTLRSQLWTHASTMVPAFTSGTTADLPVPCTYDFDVAMTKYFGALDDGEAPLTFLFSGTVFYESETGGLQAGPISWNKEAEFRLPISAWQGLMNKYYPDGAWLRVKKQMFDRLRDYKTRSGCATLEDAIERLLGEEPPSSALSPHPNPLPKGEGAKAAVR